MNKKAVIKSEEIYNLALKLVTPLKIFDTYKLIVSEAIKLTDAKSGSIFIPNDKEFKRVYTSSKKLQKIQPLTLGKTQKAFLTNRIYIDKYKDLIKKHPQFKGNQVGSDLCISLRYNRTAIGVLSLQSNPREEFSSKNIERLRLFIPLATIALKKCHLYEDLENAVQYRDLFISVASHELKTPLTPILIYSQLIHKNLPGQSSKLKNYSELLLHEIDRMKKLIEELLTVEQMRKNAFKYSMYKNEVCKILASAMEEFQKRHPERKIVIIAKKETEKVIILADSKRMIEVFINILNNSHKYSPLNKKIKIRLNHKENFLCIDFEDEGKGIKKSDLPYLFEPFFHGKDRTEGKGLGLYFVKQIVENHGGAVTIQSAFQKGTKVTVKLPIYERKSQTLP